MPITTPDAGASTLPPSPSSTALTPTHPQPKVLKVGILTDMLGQAPPEIPYLVQDLIPEQQVGLFVGDSGLGKTPFLVQLGLCTAHGVPFLEFPTQKTRTLFIDAETSETQFKVYLDRLTRFLGLQPSEDFIAYSSDWYEDVDDQPQVANTFERIRLLIEQLQPGFVILDCLRPLFPEQEEKGSKMVELWNWLKRMARRHHITFLVVHHKRKLAKDKGRIVKPSLAIDMRDWFQEAAGAGQIVTQAQYRLGLDGAPGGGHKDHLCLAGYMKSDGDIGPISVDRVKDAEGDPVGYRNAMEREFEKIKAKPELMALYWQLPTFFTHTQFKERLGAASSGSAEGPRNLFRRAGLIELVDRTNKRLGYKKLTPPYALAAEKQD